MVSPGPIAIHVEAVNQAAFFGLIQRVSRGVAGSPEALRRQLLLDCCDHLLIAEKLIVVSHNCDFRFDTEKIAYRVPGFDKLLILCIAVFLQYSLLLVFSFLKIFVKRIHACLSVLR